MDYLYFVVGTFAAIALFLLVICVILGKILGAINNMNMGTQPGAVESAPAPTPTPVVSAAPAVQKPIPNRQKIVVAISAAIAEELGTDVSAIKIKSLKKL